MSGERVVVTGGEGFLGSFVVERLRGTEWCSEVFVPRSRDYDLRILWDTSKPNGQPRRCLDAYRADQEFVAWLRYWVSEPDRGQAHAINKGFALATGDLLGWINSDDLYLPSSLRILGEAHSLYPRAILAGDVENFHDGEDSLTLVRQSNLTLRNLVDPWNGLWSGHQPGWFAPRLLHLTVGPLDESLRYAFDRDWLCRLLQRSDMEYLGQPVARFRIHATAKTTAEVPAAIREVLLVAQRYWHDVPDLDKQYVCAIHGLQEASV